MANETKTPWTQFMDMHSGGDLKLDWQYIYIEAPQTEAVGVFVSRFGRNPNRITCTCCGEDYSISEDESLEQATAYNRNCRFDRNLGLYVEEGDPSRERYRMNYMSLADYLTSGPLFIRSDEIAPDERRAVPEPEGYVWVGE